MTVGWVGARPCAGGSRDGRGEVHGGGGLVGRQRTQGVATQPAVAGEPVQQPAAERVARTHGVGNLHGGCGPVVRLTGDAYG